MKPPVHLSIGLTLLHCLLLAYSAMRHSPVVDETGHLPSGFSHWKLHRFDLFCVNPPLARAIAGLPLFLSGSDMDLRGYEELPKARPEFRMGTRFIADQKEAPVWWFTVGRWACIPFSALAAFICWKWATELYGPAGGLIAVSLWCFSPSVLGHAALMTPDAPAAATGITAGYAFHRWLTAGTARRALIAGTALGIAELTKFTWVFLFALWPVVWFCLWLRQSRAIGTLKSGAGQLLLMIVTSLSVINNGYLFEGSFQPLGRFEFFSKTLSGRQLAAPLTVGDNRFRDTVLSNIPVPVPRNFVQGIDRVKFEYERGYPSYLRGERKHGGWWYYYLYAMLVKISMGTLVLLSLAGGTLVTKVVLRCRRGPMVPRLLDELFLLTPAIVVIALVSSQTGFNHHLRYVLPAFPFLFIFAGRTALLLQSPTRWIRCVPVLLVLATIASSLSVYPHSLSYFNEPSGGSINGWKHLDYSNVDWGQDLLSAKEWADAHPEATPLFVQATGRVTPQMLGIHCHRVERHLPSLSSSEPSAMHDFPPGWYILGLTPLVNPDSNVHPFLKHEPVDYIGYSMRVYHVPKQTRNMPPQTER